MRGLAVEGHRTLRAAFRAHTPRLLVALAFTHFEFASLTAKHLKHLNEVCILEINLDQITENDYPHLRVVFSVLNASELDAVDIIHTSSCVIHRGHHLLWLLWLIGSKLRLVDLKDILLDKSTRRCLMKGGLSCQILNLSSCHFKRLSMTGHFFSLHTLKLDFNTHVKCLPEGCFRSMPKLRRLSMCGTGITNLWTTIAALSRLPILSELRFQNCLCCKDTGICPLSSVETDCYMDDNTYGDQGQNVLPMYWPSSLNWNKSKPPFSEEILQGINSGDWLEHKSYMFNSSGEDSSDDGSDEELPFLTAESIQQDRDMSRIVDQRDFLNSLIVDVTDVSNMNFYDGDSLVQPSTESRTISISNNEIENPSSENRFVRDTEMTRTSGYISGEELDNAASLDAFYDSVDSTVILKTNNLNNGYNALVEAQHTEDSETSLDFPSREIASHHPSPICFEKYYREFMIASLVGLKVLDNLPISRSERESAKTVFSEHFESVPYNRREKENMVTVLKAREMGSFSRIYTNKRQRLGIAYGDAISFARTMCAAKIGSCAWPAINPISRLKRSMPNSNRQLRPRQFEYHPFDPSLMVFGTLDGEVVVMNHESGRIVSHVQSVRLTDSILGLSWLNKDPTKLIAGSDNGTLQLYDINRMQSSVHLGISGVVNSSSNPASYIYEEFEQLTSVHVNATDDYFLASGYSKHIALYDIQSGRKLQVFENLHHEHINVVKFSHHSPYLFATSSFDKEIKLWDLRQKPMHPLHTTTSSRGNVMVCFSQDDKYFLSSAVDNEVKQYLVADGRLHMKFDIAPTGSSQNYTRSYYMNGRDYVISGSCEENIVRICCAHTGRRLRDINLEICGSRSSLYVQSLRGDPFRAFHLSVLAAYVHPDSKSEILKINLMSSASYYSESDFDPQYFPLSGMGG